MHELLLHRLSCVLTRATINYMLTHACTAGLGLGHMLLLYVQYVVTGKFLEVLT